MSCCPPEMEPARAAQGGKAGAHKTYGETSLFVAGPPQARAGVLAFPDVFGVESGRIKQDAEKLAELGYAVVVVDLARGDNVSGSSLPDWVVKVLTAIGVVEFVMRRWMTKHSYENSSGQCVKDAIAYLRNEVGVETISSYGYCWGAWIGAIQCTTETPEVTGHVSFHPSWAVADKLYGDGAVDKLAEEIKVPQLICAASNDPDSLSGGGSVEKILMAKPDIGAKCKVVDFPDVIHGWVNRGDASDPTTKASIDRAWFEAIEFLKMVNPPTKPSA